LSAESLSGRLWTGQLACTNQPHHQLRPTLGRNHAVLGEVRPVTDLGLRDTVYALPRSAPGPSGRRRPGNSKDARAHKLRELRAKIRGCLCAEVRAGTLEDDLRRRREEQYSRKLRPLLHAVP